MPQQKVDYQKINSLKGKIYDKSKEIRKHQADGTKLIEPYNIAITNLEKEIYELEVQIQEEELKIKK